MEAVHSTETLVCTNLRTYQTTRRPVTQDRNRMMYSAHREWTPRSRTFVSKRIRKVYGRNSILERPITEQVGSSGNPSDLH
jgi:hypothetical protein